MRSFVVFAWNRPLWQSLTCRRPFSFPSPTDGFQVTRRGAAVGRLVHLDAGALAGAGEVSAAVDRAIAAHEAQRVSHANAVAVAARRFGGVAQLQTPWRVPA